MGGSGDVGKRRGSKRAGESVVVEEELREATRERAEVEEAMQAVGREVEEREEGAGSEVGEGV
eukprot:96473-Rhodomonas_salina.1